MIYTSPTVRLVLKPFVSRLVRLVRIEHAKRNMPFYGSYQFVYIGQPSLLSSGACSEHHGHINNSLDMKSDRWYYADTFSVRPSVRPSILPTIGKGCSYSGTTFKIGDSELSSQFCCFCLKCISVLLVKMDTNQYGSPSPPRSKAGFQRATHSSSFTAVWLKRQSKCATVLASL